MPFEDGRLRFTGLFPSQGGIVTQSHLAQKVYCRSLTTPRLTAPENVGWYLKENADDAPATAEDKVTQNQPLKKGDGLSIGTDTTKSQNRPLEDSADEEGKP